MLAHTAMRPRERVLAAIAHQTPDRTPRDFMAVPEVWDKMLAHFNTQSREDVYRALDIDMRLFDPVHTKPTETLPDGTYYDAYGAHRKKVTNEFCTYEEYAGYPLEEAETVEELAAYPRWPSPEDWDYSLLSNQIGDLHKTYHIRYRVGGLFETAWALRGLEQFMMDMVLEPQMVHYIMDRLCTLQEEKLRRGLAAAGDKIDMVHTYDDIASQSSLLISGEMWEEFIAPYHRRLNAISKAHGKQVFYHSCGAVLPLMGEIAKLPVDVLNPIQPGAAGMDFAAIKAAYGDVLCFHGGIDIQQTLPHGTPDEVRAAVGHACATLGKGGGYILCSAHHIQADTPVENILAMYEN